MPHDFNDVRSRRWTVELTPAIVARVRELLGIDLDVCRDPAAGCRLIGELFVSGHARIVDILYVACMEQAEQRGVSDEEFGRSLGPIDKPGTAFAYAVCDRYPKLRPLIDKAALKTAKGKVRSAWEKLLGKLRRRAMGN